MSNIVNHGPCPLCPGTSRQFVVPRGLAVHISRMHRQDGTDANTSPSLQSQTQRTNVQDQLTTLPALRKNIPVLKHIPKGARHLAAGKLTTIMENCLRENSVEAWFSLLSFSFTALKVPTREGGSSLTSKVKHNIDSSSNIGGDDSHLKGKKTISLLRSIETKVYDGDLKGAVRLLLSDCSLAPNNSETKSALLHKHPTPSRNLCLPPEPNSTNVCLTVTTTDVLNALSSFQTGSAPGLDGLRPDHLKELTSASAGDNGTRLLEVLTSMCNFLLKGLLNPQVCPYLYGASLCALKKREGGIRPIAVGSSLRRLVSKLACGAVRHSMSLYLQPHQLGFGTPGGCEAAIHATRFFATTNKDSNNVILKVDLENAFNSLERDVMLKEVLQRTPELYPYLFQCYATPSHLAFDGTLISSQVGAQQGDPLGPLIFSLAIQNAICHLKSPLNVWYLDDGTLGGPPEIVAEDVRYLAEQFDMLGLRIGTSKCELFLCGEEARSSVSRFEALIPGIKMIRKCNFNLLGAPIFKEAVPISLEDKITSFVASHERLKCLSSHVALVLLRNSLAIPRMTYILRTSPAWLCPHEVNQFDEVLRSILEVILNVKLEEIQWVQASLPVRHGGIGIRRISEVSLPAFLASSHGVVNLVAKILNLDGDGLILPHVGDALTAWRAKCPNASIPDRTEMQKLWDEAAVRVILDNLERGASGAHLARIKASAQPESGAWLQAIPSPHMGTLLDNDSLRTAVALRLGCAVCEPHRCICGCMVGADGHHALGCVRSAGRLSRHHAMNDIIRRALVSANIPCQLEPPGLSRTDGKRPDGITLIPWQRGRSLLWDATCVSTYAASYLPNTTRSAGAAAKMAAGHKSTKYSVLSTQYDFVPVAVETAGPWCPAAKDFIGEIGRRLKDKGYDHRSGWYLAQRLSIAIQRGNAASIMGSFEPGTIRGGIYD